MIEMTVNVKFAKGWTMRFDANIIRVAAIRYGAGCHRDEAGHPLGRARRWIDARGVRSGWHLQRGSSSSIPNKCCARWSGLSGIYVLAEALVVFASHSKSKRCGTSAMTAEGLEDYDRGIVGRFGTRSDHTDMLQYIAVVDRSTLFAHSFRIGRNWSSRGECQKSGRAAQIWTCAISGVVSSWQGPTYFCFVIANDVI